MDFRPDTHHAYRQGGLPQGIGGDVTFALIEALVTAEELASDVDPSVVSSA